MPGMADTSTGDSYVPSEGWTEALLKPRTKICYYDFVATILGPETVAPKAVFADKNRKEHA